MVLKSCSCHGKDFSQPLRLISQGLGLPYRIFKRVRLWRYSSE
jgi:hypothetical protein